MGKKLFLAAIFVSLALIFVSAAKAQTTATSAQPTQTPAVTTNSGLSPTAVTIKPSGTPGGTSGTPRVKGLDRLGGDRLQFCQKHVDEVNTRLTTLGNLVNNMLGKFDAIVTRVEQFYTSKVVPSGKTVPNYDALVADIAAKRTAAATALANAQKDITGFTCTADNPKGQISLFRTDMQAVKDSLKDYRTSIKNLIVAVRGVVGETERVSPKPSGTPVPTST